MIKKFTIQFVILCAAVAMSQTSPQKPAFNSQEAIARVKNTMVSQLQPGMQKVTLEYYLKTQSGTGARITWEVNDCGEQTGDPANRDVNDPPICVEADVTNEHGETATLFVAVGTVKTGIKGNPKVFFISFKHSSGEVKELRRIGQIPLEFSNESGS